MVNEIRGDHSRAGEYSIDGVNPGVRLERGLKNQLDARVDPRRVRDEWGEGDPEDADPELEAKRASFEALTGFARVDDDSSGAERRGDDGEEGGSGLGLPPSPFQLVGQLSRNIAGEPARVAAPADFSRVELADRIARAAEALAVRDNAGAGESEVRIEFREDIAPETSAVIRRGEDGRTLTVEFSTADARVNLFLANGNASLRGQLAERFGCEVAVTVEYRGDGKSEHGRDGDADRRGRPRQPHWEVEG